MNRPWSLLKKRPWLSTLTVVYAAGMIAMSVPKAMDLTKNSDHWIVWQAGKDFFEGQPLYERKEERPFNYPPFAAFIAQPLHRIPLQYSALIHFLINALILLPLSVALVYRVLREAGVAAKKAEWATILVTLFTLKYCWNNLIMFQINLIVFFFILLGIWFLVRKRPRAGGIMIMLVTLVKIIPAFLLIYVLFAWYSRRLLMVLILAGLICMVLPMTFRGTDRWVRDHVEYYDHFLKPYLLEDRLVTNPVNHNLSAGIMKAFHPETRDLTFADAEQYRTTLRFISVIHYLLMAVLFVNGLMLVRKRTPFSLAYLASILLFTHLYAGITWTAHLVTFLFCLLPVALIEPKGLRLSGKIIFYAVLSLLLFLGIEGSDTTGRAIYDAIRGIDVFTILLLGLFLFSSWVAASRKAGRIYPEGVLI